MVTYSSGKQNAVHPEEARRAVSKGLSRGISKDERIRKRNYEMLHQATPAGVPIDPMDLPLCFPMSRDMHEIVDDQGHFALGFAAQVLVAGSLRSEDLLFAGNRYEGPQDLGPVQE